jgi:hypothetical protein
MPGYLLKIETIDIEHDKKYWTTMTSKMQERNQRTVSSDCMVNYSRTSTDIVPHGGTMSVSSHISA